MQQNSLVNLSVQIYRLLLYLYPAEHREEYGWLMVQMFRDCAHDAYRKQGSVGILLYWFSVLLDVLTTCIQERLEKGFTMNTSIVTRFTHYFIMMAGALIATSAFSQLQPGDHYEFSGLYGLAFMGLPTSIFAMIIGLWGFQSRYRSQFAWWGRIFLFLPIIAGGLASLFMFLLVSADFFWDVLMGAVAVMFGSLVIIGVYLLLNPVLPRWSGLVLLVSGLLPFVMFLRSPVGSPMGPLYFDFALIFSVGLCWIAFGYAVGQAEKQKLVTG